MADAAFLALSVITIGSAIAALEMRSLIYGSIALMGTLGGIAGFFFMLDAPFVALLDRPAAERPDSSFYFVQHNMFQSW